MRPDPLRRSIGRTLAGGLWVALLALIARPLVSAAQPTTTFRGGSSSVAATDSTSDAELDALTAEIASRLRCLVCRGQSVQESSSQLAREMQAIIRRKLGEGETPEEIMDFFVASYGDFILLRPPAEGLNLVVYVGPAIAFLIAFAGVAVWLRGTRRRASAEGPGAVSDMVPEDRAWLDAAIRGGDR